MNGGMGKNKEQVSTQAEELWTKSVENEYKSFIFENNLIPNLS
jgi:hypothetical protein